MTGLRNTRLFCRICVCALCTALLLLVFGCGSKGGPDNQNPLDGKGLSVSGVVSDHEGIPVEGTRVVLLSGTAEEEGFSTIHDDGSITYDGPASITDAEGNYAIEFTFNASLIYHFVVLREGILVYENAVSFTNLENVRNIQTNELELATLTGFVEDTLARPLEDAIVFTAWPPNILADADYIDFRPTIYGHCISGQDGSFTLDGIPARSLVLYVYLPGMYCAPEMFDFKADPDEFFRFSLAEINGGSITVNIEGVFPDDPGSVEDEKLTVSLATIDVLPGYDEHPGSENKRATLNGLFESMSEPPEISEESYALVDPYLYGSGFDFAATADANGSFQITNIFPATYSVWVELDGYGLRGGTGNVAIEAGIDTEVSITLE
ncbi:hypothetical protein J7K50_08260 [bacterium]|nr:hypothetical protein [bacterium]